MATKVYFNNSCSICRFEINHYKKQENNLEWIDICTEKNSKIDTKSKIIGLQNKYEKEKNTQKRRRNRRIGFFCPANYQNKMPNKMDY